MKKVQLQKRKNKEPDQQGYRVSWKWFLQSVVELDNARVGQLQKSYIEKLQKSYIQKLQKSYIWMEVQMKCPAPSEDCSSQRSIAGRNATCHKTESVYWQSVTVCQLEIIGRLCKKYLWALAHCRNLLNSAVIVALLYRASGVCQQEEIGKTFTYFMNGLPITSNWQTVTVCQ